MQPFSRETVVDRRQPALRWTAVLAGSAVAVAAWMLLQMFGSGIALSMMKSSNWNRIHAIGIGSSAWSVIAVVGALFLGGMLAGKLSGHHERRIIGLHAILVWAITSIVGVIAVTSSISMMAPSMLSRELAVQSPELRAYTIHAATTTGSAMLIAALGLTLGAIASIGGALTAAANVVRYRRHDTIPGAVYPGHTTAPYPVPSEPGTD